MARSKKRKRASGEQQRVDGGILPLLYPTSRLCTLHDLLLSLLLPSLRHPSSATTAEPLAPNTAGGGTGVAACTQKVMNKDAGHTLRENVDLLQAPMVSNVGMRQDAVSACMGVNMQPVVPADSSNMCMPQVASAADTDANMGIQHTTAMPMNMGANMGFPQARIAADMGVQQVQPPNVAMYMDASDVASIMSSKDMVPMQTTVGAGLSRQQSAPTTAAMDKVAAAHSLLVREGDPADYLHLLSHGYGVLPDTAPPLGHTMLEQRWTHQQVIERVIQILFKQGKNNSNVLCFGFQQPRPRSCLKRERTAPAGLACISDNAAVTVLNSQIWRTIHARVGDSIMLHLLSYADIFQPLPHKCYVQIAGTSVLLFARQIKASEQGAAPVTKILTDKWDAFRKIQRVGRSKDTERQGGVIDIGAHMNSSNRHYVTDGSVHHQVMSRKRRRPHSWQRRKARRLYDKQAEQEGGFTVVKERRIHSEPDKQEFVMTASETCLASSLDIMEGYLATQEELVTVLEGEDDIDSNTKNDDRSHNMQMLILGKSRPFEKARKDLLNKPMPGLSSQQTLFCSATTIYEQLNEDTEKQKLVDFSTRSSIAKLAFGIQQEQVLKVFALNKFNSFESKINVEN